MIKNENVEGEPAYDETVPTWPRGHARPHDS